MSLTQARSGGQPSKRRSSTFAATARLTASILNSSVYCRFGTDFSDMQSSVHTGNLQNSCCTRNRDRVKLATLEWVAWY
ncbi:hypothetical protein, partial [Burkholderia glumae]|uniref:hypothetical protein n=1 Tax=Burkholderia glumae TaxID=337 RepID=UPI0019D70B6B